MVTFLIALIISLVPINAHALVVSDPMGNLQRAQQFAEQKIQTLRLYKLTIDMVNNVKAARMTYDLAKSGYSRLTNPEEWKAFAEYSKYRLQLLADPAVDPAESSLFQTVIAVDQAADAYIFNTRLYGAIESTFNTGGNALNSFDEGAADLIDKINPERAFDAIRTGAEANRDQWIAERQARLRSNARRYLAASQKNAENLRSNADLFQDESIKLNEELSRIEKMEFYAEQDYAIALERLQNSGDDANLLKAAQFQVDRAHQISSDMRQRKEDTLNRMEDLDREGKFLIAQIEENEKKLEINMTALGAEEAVREIVTNRGLSSMAYNHELIESTRRYAFSLLLIGTALGLLWIGFKGIDGIHLGDPVGFLKGLIAAFILLTPGSLTIDVIAKELAILIDGTEMSVFGSTMKASADRFTDFFSNAVGSFTQTESPQSQSRILSRGVMGLFGGTALLGNLAGLLLQIFGFIGALIGVVAIILSMSVRNVLYWVVMGVAPLLIALAPLPFVRKSVLPGWGKALYGLLLWGPIMKIVLLINQGIIHQSSLYLQNILSTTSLLSLLLSLLDGVTVMVLMVGAFGLAFSLAFGSFDGMVASLGATMGIGVSMAAKPAFMVGGAMVSKIGGGLGQFGTNLKSTSIAKDMNPVMGNRGPVGRGFRQMSGSFLQGVGQRMNKAGTTIGTKGKGMKYGQSSF